MKNIKINMKMKNFFEYKRLKNHDTYDYKQFEYKQFTIDETLAEDTNGNVINNNCNSSKNLSTISEKNIITGNSKNKINLNWKLPTTIQTTKITETTNITNIPATIVTSTNKAIITTIKNPLLNLDEQEEKNYIQTTYNNTKYNKKKKKSKFILKTIKFPRKYMSVQQLQQQQFENLQQLQHETYLKSKNLKKNSKKIQLDFSNSYSKKNQKKVENFKENHFNNNNNNSNSNNNIDELQHNLPKTINITTNTTPVTKIPIQTTTKTIEHLIPITTKSTNKPTKAKILYSIISDTKPFYTTKATSLETLTTLTTKQTKQFNLKREKEKDYFYSKPKSKIYDYMKDFLRKKFNTLTPTSSRKETSKTTTTTTAGSSLHDEDIYVEFPNCLLKVINNNLGSQKETFQQQQQHNPQHQYQQQRSYSQHNSPRHHPRYQHLHLPLQNHYQPDTPKKLQKFASQPHQQQQQQQQQQQHQQSDQPSSSLDNNSKRYDVMQDVRIKLEQLHKKQQLQQQQQQHNQSNNLLQQNFQFQQQQQQQQQQQNHLHNHNHNHNQIQNQNQNKNQNLNHNNSPTHHQHHQQQQQQQQHNQQQNGSPNISNNITPRHRPIHLFPPSQANLNTNGNEPPPPHSPSSEEDNSPTEMNNCRRLVDKPPLVKRITMGLFGLNEDSRPLVHTKTTTLSNEQQLQEQQQNLGSTTTIDGYVNESICEPEKIISSKFGDSCRQSLTAISTLDTNHFNLDNSEFSFKKKYMRETCSANSSPRIFGPSALLKNKGGLSPTEQIELKGAAWFQAGISREIAVEILSSQSPGQFLVRQSTSKSDCFVLTVRVPPPAPKVAHYLILRTIRGYKIKGFTKEFTSLKALITHHSVMPELLPVPLALPRPTTNTPRRRNVDDFESYGSLRLLGILNMMQTNHNFDRENNS